MEKRAWRAGLLALAGMLLGLWVDRRRKGAGSQGPTPPPPPGTAGDREPRRPLPTSGAGAMEAPLP